ncbi:MAG: ATP/GTP-binding protein, partial [Ruminococcus flavefaciens]|nr:ATP/GTP-binding protein [Ruminococcus flavefaciens]
MRLKYQEIQNGNIDLLNADHFLVLVCGPAASGKSTLVRLLSEYYSAYLFKPSQAYLELANMHNIPLENAFLSIDQNEAEEFFCLTCKSHKMVIGDQHLAIQYYRDSLLATGSAITEEYKNEPYECSISEEFIDKISNCGINI